MAASRCESLACDGLRLESCNRVTRHLPKHLLLARTQRSVVCRGLAEPRGLLFSVDSFLDKLFCRRKQVHEGDLNRPEAIEIHDASARQHHSSSALGATILHRTASALQIGMRWTGVALRLAKIVVDDMRRSIASKIQRPNPDAQASQLMKTAQEQLLLKARGQMLEEHSKDAAFMQMLRNLDRCHMDHEEKWSLFTKLSADKADFSERWRHLYDLALESKAAVDTLLRPDASRCERNSFWKSAQTSAIIAEEDALKQLVFAQVYQAQKN